MSVELLIGCGTSGSLLRIGRLNTAVCGGQLLNCVVSTDSSLTVGRGLSYFVFVLLVLSSFVAVIISWILIAFGVGVLAMQSATFSRLLEDFVCLAGCLTCNRPGYRLPCNMQLSLDMAAGVTTIFQVVLRLSMLGYRICELAACDLWIRWLVCIYIEVKTFAAQHYGERFTFGFGEGSAGVCNHLPFVAVGS